MCSFRCSNMIRIKNSQKWNMIHGTSEIKSSFKNFFAHTHSHTHTYTKVARCIYIWRDGKSADLWSKSKRVRTPVAPLRSILNWFFCKTYDYLYPFNYWLNSITAVLLQSWIRHLIIHKDWCISSTKRLSQTFPLHKLPSSHFETTVFLL